MQNAKQWKYLNKSNRFSINAKLCASDNFLNARRNNGRAKELKKPFLNSRRLSECSFVRSIDRNTLYLNEEISNASFKRNFAASCLPSSVWNRSLPNLCFSLAFDYSSVNGNDQPMTHSTSVEYFTPEPNFIPQCGAYCMWSSGDSSQYFCEGKFFIAVTCLCDG